VSLDGRAILIDGAQLRWHKFIGDEAIHESRLSRARQAHNNKSQRHLDKKNISRRQDCGKMDSYSFGGGMSGLADQMAVLLRDFDQRMCRGVNFEFAF